MAQVDIPVGVGKSTCDQDVAMGSVYIFGLTHLSTFLGLLILWARCLLKGRQDSIFKILNLDRMIANLTLGRM